MPQTLLRKFSVQSNDLEFIQSIRDDIDSFADRIKGEYFEDRSSHGEDTSTDVLSSNSLEYQNLKEAANTLAYICDATQRALQVNPAREAVVLDLTYEQEKTLITAGNVLHGRNGFHINFNGHEREVLGGEDSVDRTIIHAARINADPEEADRLGNALEDYICKKAIIPAEESYHPGEMPTGVVEVTLGGFISHRFDPARVQ